MSSVNGVNSNVAALQTDLNNLVTSLSLGADAATIEQLISKINNDYAGIYGTDADAANKMIQDGLTPELTKLFSGPISALQNGDSQPMINLIQSLERGGADMDALRNAVAQFNTDVNSGYIQ